MFRNKFHFALMLKSKNPKFLLWYTKPPQNYLQKKGGLFIPNVFFFFVLYIFRIKCDDGYVTVTYPLYIEDRKKNIELNDLNHILYIDYMASIHTIFILFIYLFLLVLSMYKLSIPLHISHWLCIVINII